MKSKSLFTLKRNRYLSRTRKQKRSQHGGGKIDLRQILISQPIADAVAPHDVSGYKMSRESGGFPLRRLGRMMNANFNALLAEEPVELRKAVSRGKPMGAKIDGVMKPLYEIVNGRHRIARAIIESRESIDAIIVDE